MSDDNKHPLQISSIREKKHFEERMKARHDFLTEFYGDANRVLQMLEQFHSRQFKVDLFLSNYSDLLFDGENPFFRLDGASLQRKLKFNETDFIYMYDIEDPTDALLDIPHRTLGVFAQKHKADSSFLKKYGFDLAVDFEIFESPSLLDETYQFPLNKIAKYLHSHTDNCTGELRHFVRKNTCGLYVEMEKIHLRFGRKNNQFFPIYVGIGANEPLGLRISGEMGSQRFEKHNFETGTTGYAHGILEKRSVTQKEKNIIDKMRESGTFVAEEYLDDNSRVYCVNYEDTMTYFLDEKTILVPSFTYNFVSQDEYYDTLFRQQDPLGEIVSTVSRSVVDYQEFARFAYDPLFLIQTCGLSAALNSRKKIRAVEQISEIPLNLASDLYERNMDDRLKLGSLLLSRLYQTEELEDILSRVADDKMMCYSQH